jgi:hypothetical protein
MIDPPHRTGVHVLQAYRSGHNDCVRQEFLRGMKVRKWTGHKDWGIHKQKRQPVMVGVP